MHKVPTEWHNNSFRPQTNENHVFSADLSLLLLSATIISGIYCERFWHRVILSNEILDKSLILFQHFFSPLQVTSEL